MLLLKNSEAIIPPILRSISMASELIKNVGGYMEEVSYYFKKTPKQ